MREYALCAAIAAAVTYLVTPLARRLALRVGAMAQPRDRDVHSIPTPRLGGLALYAGIATALFVSQRLPTLRGASRNNSVTTAVLVAGGVICLLGAIDDKWGLDALTKLAGQTVAAGVMVLLGVQMLFLLLPGSTFIFSPSIGVPVTVLLTVMTVNAINFIDGLDGLAAGVVAIAALGFFAYSYELSVVQGIERASPPTLLTAVLAGACVGFLPHNFNPARVFMGDSGSMLIGLMLAAATTSVTGQVGVGALRGGDFLPILLPVLLPLAVLAVPFGDLLLAVFRRARAGRSPFSPDKAHLHHRLLEIGHSHRRAVLIMYFWSALLASGVVALSITGGLLLVISVTGTLAVAAIIASAVPRLRSGGLS